MSGFERLNTAIAWTGETESDAQALLLAFGREDIWTHVQAVAEVARGLALRFQLNKNAAYQAGLLHDVAWIYTPAQMLERAESLGVKVFETERQLPMLLHQKLGAEMASRLFGASREVQNAIGCHTTLKAAPTPLEQLIFLSDKLAPFEAGEFDTLPALEEAVQHSLSEGCVLTLRHYWIHRADFKVVHPWLEAAWKEFLPVR